MDETYYREQRTYHIIWVRHNKTKTFAFYSEMECFNPDFYSRMMESEFNTTT